MSKKINPLNRTARLEQLRYRAVGNPASTLPTAAISNCFPGLEYDFKNFWRRTFQGLVLLECDNYVVETEDNALLNLLHHRLLRVESSGKHWDLVTTVYGPQIPGGDAGPLGTGTNPNAVVFMEWSNALAFIRQLQGQVVKCFFTKDVADKPQPIPADTSQMCAVDLTVREIFDGESAAPARDVLLPGELTQGLCSPWQHDYRECACYYWPATRPDYVNVEVTPEGVSRGDNWVSKERSGDYILDDRKDDRLVSYDDLFTAWEKMLRFQIKGHDGDKS